MKADLEFIENNDPVAEFHIARTREEPDGTTTTVPVPLTGATVEVYVKESKDASDDDALVFSSDTPTEIEVTEESAGIVRVFFTDVNMEDYRWYHLDVIKDARRLTHAYGKIKVVNV